MIKLHLGCGKRDFGPDWIHIDQGHFPHVKHHDIVNLPYLSCVDVIYASHVFEYFDREEALSVLHLWRSALKPGGVLRLAVPDFYMMSMLYYEGKITIEQILGPLYGKMNVDGKQIYHKTTYDFDSLNLLLTKALFNDIRIYDWRLTEHSHIDDHSQAYIPHMAKDTGTLISLNVECTK